VKRVKSTAALEVCSFKRPVPKLQKMVGRDFSSLVLFCLAVATSANGFYHADAGKTAFDILEHSLFLFAIR
jgi:hypothetical protein